MGVDQDAYRAMRETARRSIIERYDLARVCLPAWLDLLRELA